MDPLNKSEVCLRVIVSVSWPTQMAGGQRGRSARRTGSSAGEFWLRGSDGGTNPGLKAVAAAALKVWVTLPDTGHTQTFVRPLSPKDTGFPCVCV